MAMAAVLVLLAGVLSVALRLGIGKRLAIATARTIIQLGLLGLVLEWIFSGQRWYVVLALLGSMTINAGVAAVRRTERRFLGIYRDGLTAITISSVVTMFIVVEFVVQVRPWHEARYIIPLLGIVLAHSLTGLSLCLDRLMSDLDEKGHQVEAWLALGATGWEAARPFVSDAVRTGMIPILNSMTVVGIVSIPGMMTGQILAGAAPMEAVKYQVVVMFMIALASNLAAVTGALFVFRRVVTKRHQLASHRLMGR